MSDNNSGFGNGLLIGVVVGVLGGLLLAPQSGSATRKHLKRKAKYYFDNAADMAEDAAETWDELHDEAKPYIKKYKNKYAPLAKNIFDKIANTAGDVLEQTNIKAKLDDVAHELETAIDDVSQKAEKVRKHFFNGVK